MNGIGVSAVNAYSAHREWASRPPDERYASVQALYDAASARRLHTEERTIETVALRTEAVAFDALALRDTSNRESALTNWSFEQLAGIARSEIGHHRINVNVRIDLPDTVSRSDGLRKRLFGVGLAVEKLPLQVAELHEVAID